jgi:hypothetical protein
VFAHFKVSNQPAIVVIGADGTSRTFFGAVDDARLDEAVSDAIA